MRRALSRKNIWERVPLRLRAALGAAVGIVPESMLLGRRFRQTLRFAHEAQSWTWERSREYQLGKVRALLRLAYERTAFYRGAFDSAGFNPNDLMSLTGIRALPCMDKSAVRENMHDMCARRVDHSSVDQCTTGGSGGTPLVFYIGKERSAVEYAYTVGSWGRAGYKLGDTLGVLRGKCVRRDRKGLYHEHDPILHSHYYSTYHMTDENMGRYLDHIRTLGPCFLHVYPSAVAMLARFIQRSGVGAPDNIRGIIAESENVYPEQRAEIERVFGVRMFSCYGQSEKVVLAAECEHSTDYHVWPTYGYFELLDERGEPVTTPGQRGEIVGTGFINTVMPFIRYRTGDYATYVGDRCEACGREHTIIRDIRGHRTQEVLVAKDGAEIPWTGLCPDGQEEAFIHVRQLQFRQDTPGVAVLRLVPSPGYTKATQRRIEEFFEHKLAGTVRFTCELTEKITLSPRGKVIYVDQRVTRRKVPC